MRFSSFSAFAALAALGTGSAIAPADAKLFSTGQSDVQITRRQNAPAYAAHMIDMPIDHFPKSSRYRYHTNATFKQRYFFDETYYKPGGPVFLYISGETSGESRFSNLQTGIIQVLMRNFNGLGVILENRYYGESYPFNSSTTDNLAFLTTEQTIADNAYFAQHASFPGVNGSLNAPGTPWILYGGSLAGAQTAFSVKTYPDVLYGGIASSGTTKALLSYPEWYNPIQKYAPQDCVSSINGIIAKMDHLSNTGNRKAISQLKAIFGLEALTDNRDFAMTIAFPIGGPMNYPTNTWQELNWNPAYGSNDFFEFCSNVTNLNAPPNITVVDNLLANYTHGKSWDNLGNYANYIKQALLPLCPDGDYNNVACFGTQNETYYADPTNSGSRSYLYSTCTEDGAYQVAPKSGPSLIWNVLQIDYTQQWCNWSFPAGEFNKIPPSPELHYNNKYGGYNVVGDRLAHIDGDNDVWLDLCYHSHYAPPRESSTFHPEYLITGAGHHWDSYGINDVAAEPQFIREAHLWEIRTVERWLRDFENWKPTRNFRDEL
ncbi:extracelular serine carboxypeptidase-like protein [Aulographum hederae CBS 113979]|uniref:Extracelular serine carboxypeptidase-like protein n=1 Tax=Aulographum hederae CBS 113979 TaxID=1176131 RepID=A0A6G1HHL2_9PEZI|nr:extracelular serine carboxypeptidase-like protein [Aulographum hederae CBS 113979]